jgi:predicted metal-dependent hydrolase
LEKQIDKNFISRAPINIANHRYIFMRWKEKLFVNVQEASCGLTIAGFYYACLNRTTGIIDGFYFDRNSTPYQQLRLEPEKRRWGIVFADYSFA